MVREIDRRMVGWAIELIARSEADGKPISYEVNLSARSLSDRGAPERRSPRCIEGAGIDPSLLVFEITETAAIANMEQAREFAGALRKLGCRFALDDFGAGFASFYYLKHIPLDALKIDGDFIRNMRSNTTDQLLVKHMARDRARASASTRSPSSSRTRRRSRCSASSASTRSRATTSADRPRAGVRAAVPGERRGAVGVADRGRAGMRPLRRL